VLQISFNKQHRRRHRNRHGAGPHCLLDLARGEQGTLDRIDLPVDACGRLMELGFVPGTPVVAAGSAPGGDPLVFRVDGSQVALRRETAAHLMLRRHECPAAD
jgi:ferrous iron transport protein A